MKKIQLDDFEMYVDPSDSGVCRNLIKRAGRLQRGEDPGLEREPAFTFLLRETLITVSKHVEKTVYMDLGANVGLFTLIMNFQTQEHWIEAIEPDPKNYEILLRNMELNKVKGEATRCAIADFTGPGKFHMSTYSNLGALIPHGKTDAGTADVDVYTIPDFIKETVVYQPHFIKMDIEGGEVEALKGARAYFSGLEEYCAILMEVHPMFYTTKRSLETELEFLFANGWRCEYMVSAAVMRPDKFVDAGLDPCKNFPTKGHSRAIYWRGHYGQLNWHDLVLDFACHPHTQKVPGKKASPKIVRSILLEKNWK